MGRMHISVLTDNVNRHFLFAFQSWASRACSACSLSFCLLIQSYLTKLLLLHHSWTGIHRGLLPCSFSVSVPIAWRKKGERECAVTIWVTTNVRNVSSGHDVVSFPMCSKWGNKFASCIQTEGKASGAHSNTLKFLSVSFTKDNPEVPMMPGANWLQVVEVDESSFRPISFRRVLHWKILCIYSANMAGILSGRAIF